MLAKIHKDYKIIKHYKKYEYIHFVHSQHQTQDKCILRGVLWQNSNPPPMGVDTIRQFIFGQFTFDLLAFRQFYISSINKIRQLWQWHKIWSTFIFESLTKSYPSLSITLTNPRIISTHCNNSRFKLVLKFNMENWARANFILSSRKKNILEDRQNFEFKRESETGL